MTNRMDRIIDEAAARGVVDGALVEAEKHGHPWPIVIMTAVMTVLASLPITGVLFLLFADGPGKNSAVFVGLVVVASAVAFLRMTPLPLFLEYLCVSLLGGGLCLTMIDSRFTGLVLTGVLTLALTTVVTQAWLRALLAAVSVQLLLYAATRMSNITWYPDRFLVWSACHAGVLAWLAAHTGLTRAERTGKFGVAAWLESVLIGSTVALLGYLTYLSGSTFLVSGLLNDYSVGQVERGSIEAVQPWISVIGAIGASAWLVLRPETGAYRRWIMAAAPVAIVVSWFAASLGAILLMAVTCLVWRRTRLAMLAGVAALWTIGTLYYAIDWPLLYKSLLLAGAGAILLGSSLLIEVTESDTVPAQVVNDRVAPQWTKWGLVVPAVLVLAIINHGIWQKEQVLRQGTTVFVELAPVDPRSLMQGDYMALSFALPASTDTQMAESGFVVAKRSTNGVATLARFHDGASALAEDELLIEVAHQGTGYVLVTNAWFFKEGEAGRWSGARYGEFRVDRNGKAVLVTLRGAKLEKL